MALFFTGYAAGVVSILLLGYVGLLLAKRKGPFLMLW
jgi:hypothetical protein